MKALLTFLCLSMGLLAYGQNPGNCECIQPDNGMGTIALPAMCPDSSVVPLEIIDGLPPGTTIEIDAVITDQMEVSTVPGGTLGGEIIEYSGAMQMVMTGTGDLAGYSRMIPMLINVVMHTAPRTPGDPIQTFNTDVNLLSGSIFGDPDFDVLQITAGTSFGLPSPGSMTLTDLNDGTFNVESFYDLGYQIDFVGAPGSVLDGLSGTTTGTSRFEQGSAECIMAPIPTLSQWGIVILGLCMVVVGLLYFRKRMVA